MAGSFLQTTGIASQASDAFDTERQQRRLLSQREQMNQSELDDNQLYRAIVKMAYENQMAREAAKESAKVAPAKGKPGVAAPAAPIAPTVPGTGAVPLAGDPMAQTGEEPSPFAGGFANGGPVTTEKFSGIYDDAKVGNRLPTVFHEAMQDWDTPGFSHGLNFEPTVHELVHHANSYADGGIVDPAADPNADPNAPAPDADQKKILDTLLTTGVATPPDVNAVVPGIKVTTNPTNLPGRLVNSQDPAINLVDQGGRALSGNKGDAANPSSMRIPRAGDADSQGGPGPGPGNTDGTGSVAPSPAGVAAAALGAALFAANPAIALANHLVTTTLFNNAFAPAPDTTIGEAVAADPDAGVAGGPDDPGAPGVDASTGANSGESPDSGPAASADAGPGADAGDGGPSAGDGGPGGGDGGGAGGDLRNGGVLWSHLKRAMTPKAAKKTKPAAVKFKKNGGALKAPKGGPGGKVKGPGSGTSDSVKASLVGPSGKQQGLNLSNGEYVLSADTVRAIGKDKLDALQAQYHKPVR